MLRSDFLLVLLLAAMVLVSGNQVLRKDAFRNSAEITSYEYQKLHAAMARHDEIEDTVMQELTQDRVTVAQYNKIMDQVRVIELKEARQLASVHGTMSR